MVDVEEFWAKTEKMHKSSDRNKMLRHREQMQFDREMIHDFFWDDTRIQGIIGVFL